MRDNLVALRGNMGQKEVASELGISQQALSAIERGGRNPSVKLMVRFSEYYGTSVMELFPDVFLGTNTAKRSKENQKEAS